jgi:hypothetical protein
LPSVTRLKSRRNTRASASVYFFGKNQPVRGTPERPSWGTHCGLSKGHDAGIRGDHAASSIRFLAPDIVPSNRGVLAAARHLTVAYRRLATLWPLVDSRAAGPSKAPRATADSRGRASYPRYPVGTRPAVTRLSHRAAPRRRRRGPARPVNNRPTPGRPCPAG